MQAPVRGHDGVIKSRWKHIDDEGRAAEGGNDIRKKTGRLTQLFKLCSTMKSKEGTLTQVPSAGGTAQGTVEYREGTFQP